VCSGFYDFSNGTQVSLGLQDQLVALQWIHEFGAYFNGDPARVTLAGIGDGAACVSALIHMTRDRWFEGKGKRAD